VTFTEPKKRLPTCAGEVTNVGLRYIYTGRRGSRRRQALLPFSISSSVSATIATRHTSHGGVRFLHYEARETARSLVETDDL
jgi:hypothetical protein